MCKGIQYMWLRCSIKLLRIGTKYTLISLQRPLHIYNVTPKDFFLILLLHERKIKKSLIFFKKSSWILISKLLRLVNVLMVVLFLRFHLPFVILLRKKLWFKVVQAFCIFVALKSLANLYHVCRIYPHNVQQAIHIHV